MTLYAGLMSGTSMDAIDAVVADFEDGKMQLVATHSAPLPEALRARLQHAVEHGALTLEELGALDVTLGRHFANALQALIERHGIEPEAIAAVGSHGQTLHHAPQGDPPSTLQIGDPHTIAQRCGITTVADFRRRDLAAGGEGAPLVPAFHEALFRHPEQERLILNIGGIANLTRLPPSGEGAVSGFDTGPGNTLLDLWCHLHRARPYDEGGRWARQGRLHQGLLERMLADPFFLRPPPKSTGREHFNLRWLQNHLENEMPADVQRTLLELTVESIARAIEGHAPKAGALYLCGGGAFNTFLVERLNQRLERIEVDTTEALGLPPRWVEACAFAWLAKRTMEGKPGNLPEVTGAKEAVILGAIHPAG